MASVIGELTSGQAFAIREQGQQRYGMPKDNHQTSEPKLGYPGGLATKFAADARADALRAVVREIQAAGFATLKDITDELNRRGVPAARGANGWYRSSVARLLTRLRALELKPTNDKAESATRPGAQLPPG